LTTDEARQKVRALEELVECLRSEAVCHPDGREVHDDWRAFCHDLDLAAAATGSNHQRVSFRDSRSRDAISSRCYVRGLAFNRQSGPAALSPLVRVPLFRVSARLLLDFLET